MKVKHKEQSAETVDERELNSVLIGDYDKLLLETTKEGRRIKEQENNYKDIFDFIARRHPELSAEAVAEVSRRTQADIDAEKGNGTAQRASILPPLPTAALAEFEGGRGSDPVAFAKKHYGVWIDGGVMDWDALYGIDDVLAKRIQSFCQNNKRRGKSGPKAITEVFPRAPIARENRVKAYGYGALENTALKEMRRNNSRRYRSRHVK